MSEERFDRLEGMMSQLITMTGNMHNTMIEMQTRMDGMEKSMDGMEKRMDGMEKSMDKMETKNELRHREVMNQIKRLERDQDFIWEKAVRNERELEIMKRTMES